MGLKDQHVLVTGASKGIGKAISRELLSQGARVSLHYHTDEEGVQELGSAYPESQTSYFQADLEDMAAVQQLFQEAIKRGGKLDSLVLNAGIFMPHSADLDTDSWWAIWKKTLTINLDACGLLTKLALDHFKENGGGRILYIGSRAAFRGETEEYLAYAASKGGLTSLARSVARSFGKHGIKSFIIAPGMTRTKMAEPFIQDRGEAYVLGEISLDRLTEPEDIAPLVSFICSGKMDHATGTTIDINAGSYMH